LMDGDTFLEAADGRKPVIDARGITGAGGVDGNPENDAATEEWRELRLHHAGDGGDDAFDHDRSRQDNGGAVGFTLPELVADDDGLGAILGFGGIEDAAEDGLGTEQSEEVGRQILYVHGAGLAESRDAGGVVLAEQADVVEDMILRAPVDIFSDGR